MRCIWDVYIDVFMGCIWDVICFIWEFEIYIYKHKRFLMRCIICNSHIDIHDIYSLYAFLFLSEKTGRCIHDNDVPACWRYFGDVKDQEIWM